MSECSTDKAVGKVIPVPADFETLADVIRKARDAAPDVVSGILEDHELHDAEVMDALKERAREAAEGTVTSHKDALIILAGNEVGPEIPLHKSDVWDGGVDMGESLVLLAEYVKEQVYHNAYKKELAEIRDMRRGGCRACFRPQSQYMT